MLIKVYGQSNCQWYKIVRPTNLSQHLAFHFHLSFKQKLKFPFLNLCKSITIIPFVFVRMMSPNHFFDNYKSKVELYSDMAFTNGHMIFANPEDEKYKDDSGIDCEDLPLEIPDAEVLSRIVLQVESYFSDDNLIRDEFMVKNLRRNKGGYINLKLVTSFRRVKAITKDWRVVAHAIQIGSEKLEINENGTKVRRKQPLQPVDGSNKYSRTVIVINLPSEKDNIDEIYKDFSMFGKIGLIRIIKPKASHPNHLKLLNHIHKSMDNISSEKPIAAIEFNFKQSAELCIEYQTKLAECDSVWSDVELHLLKKESENIAKETSPTRKCDNRPMRLANASTHVINKPVDNEMIVITVTSSTVTLTSKLASSQQKKISKSSTSIVHNESCRGTPPNHNITRNPFGPDGSRGFAHLRPNL